MKKEDRCIFVDLDETLIHSCRSDSEIPAPEEVAPHIATVKFADNDIYKTILRPGAHELLAKLRELGEIYMLTRADWEYGVKMNEVFGFGYPIERVYGRKHIKKFKYMELGLPKNKMCYLIDDFHQHENSDKIYLIRTVCGPVKYIQVPTFLGHKENEFTPELIKAILDQIQLPPTPLRTQFEIVNKTSK